MINLGEVQELKVDKIIKAGALLKDAEGEKVLLPIEEIENEKNGDIIKVFLYNDSRGKVLATKIMPKITLGKIAHLEVREITKIGAFLDWGLEKELFLPFKEQICKLDRGRSYLVALYIDKTGRLCSTMKIRDYLRTDSKYKENDKVSGVVYNIVDDIGAFVAIDNIYEALLPKDQKRGVVAVGEPIRVRVSSVKSDGRLNLSQRERGHLELDKDAELIFDVLEDYEGFLPYNDKSDPDDIQDMFCMSKSAFKKAVGRLLKENKIEFFKDGIKIKEDNIGRK
ncbi:CvfB family protein [Lagierella massiliensis]|uniref:CvfB family protein n=1 Tax=Lagierella massiliensis TaxID=1689303 RepID=UPI0006D83151|nr:S1-like domain-containing RNA-binding protein [Lagierella massiliensis]